MIVIENMSAKYPTDIEKADIKHIDAIFKIEQKCFPGRTSYSKRQLEYLLLHANSTCFIAKHEGVVRAFLMVTYRHGSLVGHIETIDVNPAFQNKGIGLKLLEAAELDMKQRGMHWSQLEVSEGNQAALKLYRKAGYELKERIEDYYVFEHNGTRNAIRMVKAL